MIVAPEPISMATESETRFLSDPMPMNAAVLLMKLMRERSCVQVATLSIVCDFSSIASHGYQTSNNERRRDDCALAPPHDLRVVSAISRRSDPGRALQRHLFLDAGREALHRLQQSIDVRQHRSRRRTCRACNSTASRDV